MEKEGASYPAVLKEAQDLGFAEANPSADVDGFDVQAKISILAKLAFGISVKPSDVPTKGMIIYIYVIVIVVIITIMLPSTMIDLI
jgi:homoserine dehydrogenase